MATHRGFVQSIQVDRAAVATIVVVHTDATIGTYIIQDLDGDPERFNERLSKLAILRDAMNRAEPVEIVHERSEQGEQIDSAVRITRDAIAPLSDLQQQSGIVVDLVVLGQNGANATGDLHCQATVTLLAGDLSTSTSVLDLQLPERLVASDQLSMLRDAQNTGTTVRLVVSAVAEATPKIVSVALGDAYGSDGNGGRQATQISGFVETLSLIKDFPTESTVFAHVRFTTAPDFTGSGNSVSNAPFDPQTIDLLVPRSSLAYDLFEVALRDKLRMRVQAAQMQPAPGRVAADANIAPAATNPSAPYWIVIGAELVAPLASASRPVWVKVSRESLDCGPSSECAEGVPSSDLTVSTLRDLKIPYAAAWEGIGCFNHGVYRFQFQLASPFKVAVDCKPLCLHDSSDPAVKFAYACLDGDHCVEICLEKWTCDQEFTFDAYRLR